VSTNSTLNLSVLFLIAGGPDNKIIIGKIFILKFDSFNLLYI